MDDTPRLLLVPRGNYWPPTSEADRIRAILSDPDRKVVILDTRNYKIYQLVGCKWEPLAE